MRSTALAILAGIVLGTGAILCLESRAPRSVVRSRWPRVNQDAPPESVAALRRTESKTHLARRVVVEQIPLLTAAEMFRQINGDEGMRLLALAVEGCSDRERLCRQVIGYVIAAEAQMEREGSPVPEPRTSAVLRAEFDRRLAAGEFLPESEAE